MNASPKLSVRYVAIVLLVVGLISSSSKSALAELEFITQNIGYPVQYFEPVDIEGDGIWELALQVGKNGEMVGVYRPLSGQWLDGPHPLPIEGNNWGCGDFDADGSIEYLYLQDTGIRAFYPIHARDTLLFSVTFTLDLLQVWGKTDSGEPIVHLCQQKTESSWQECGYMESPALTENMSSHWHRFSISSGIFLDSTDGG